jgi:hypothetical protein
MARPDSKADFFGVERIASLVRYGRLRRELGGLELGRFQDGLSSFHHQVERCDRVYRVCLCRRHRTRRILALEWIVLIARRSGSLYRRFFFAAGRWEFCRGACGKTQPAKAVSSAAWLGGRAGLNRLRNPPACAPKCWGALLPDAACQRRPARPTASLRPPLRCDSAGDDPPASRRRTAQGSPRPPR